jgi:hypothetical protein
MIAQDLLWFERCRGGRIMADSFLWWLAAELGVSNGGDGILTALESMGGEDEENGQ